MICARGPAIIGAESRIKREGMPSKPVALLGDSLLRYFSTLNSVTMENEKLLGLMPFVR